MIKSIRFCISLIWCGVVLTAIVAHAAMTCPKCGTVSQKDDYVYCSNCGSPLKKQSKPAPARPQDSTPPEIYNTDITFKNASVIVTGAVRDSSGIRAVFVNEVQARVDQSGAYAVEIPLTNSTRTVVVSAEDVLGNKGQKIVLERGAERSISPEASNEAAASESADTKPLKKKAKKKAKKTSNSNTQ